MALWGLEPPQCNKLVACFLGADPRLVGKQLKWQEENLGKKHTNSLATRSTPEPPGRIELSIIIRFLSKSAQGIHAIFEK